MVNSQWTTFQTSMPILLPKRLLHCYLETLSEIRFCGHCCHPAALSPSQGLRKIESETVWPRGQGFSSAVDQPDNCKGHYGKLRQQRDCHSIMRLGQDTRRCGGGPMDDPEKQFQCRPGELILTRGTRAVKLFKYSPHVPSFAF